MINVTGAVWLDPYAVIGVYYSEPSGQTIVMFSGGETLGIAASDVVAEAVSNINAARKD
jgi:hypothetical protein